jgi:hypothetical protein
MSEKKVTITATGISQKQWSTLILELNIMRKAWKPVGVDLTIHTFKVDSIIKRGTSNKSLTPCERNLKEE